MAKWLLAQINTIVGDIQGNLQRSLDALELGKQEGAGLVLFPEQTLTGYPAKDLLHLNDFVARNETAVHEFARATVGGPAALIGFTENHGGPGTGLYNSAALCRGGVVEAVYRKRLLPTYDVFDEDRYFDEGDDILVVEHQGLKLGITICEDMWSDTLYMSRRLYESDPIGDTAEAGADVVLNISASPFTLGKRQKRKELMAAAARKHGVPIVQVNLVGANDDLIFDGSSCVSSPDDPCTAQARGFETDFLLLDVNESHGKLQISGPVVADDVEMEELLQALLLGIRDYCNKCGFRSVYIGLSGGIDSALVAALATQALGAENVFGVSMPSRYSSEHSKDDARMLAENLGISYTVIPIEDMFARSLETLSPHLKGPYIGVAEENIQARLRGLTLMALSNASGALVLTTGNKSEMSVGYCTLYGDMAGGLAAIADVPKLMVYQLSRHINERAGREIIPENTLTKPPSAELRPDQKDSDSLPDYTELDPIVRGYVEESLDEEALVARGHDRETVQQILKLINRNEYKRRQAPPSLKVTSRAFGFGWRMPIAKR